MLATYSDVAKATYEDAWLTAKDLQGTIDAFLAEAGAATHEAAEDAWLAARGPHQQAEASRFGDPVVQDRSRCTTAARSG